MTKDDYAILTKDPTVLKKIVDQAAITFSIDPKHNESHHRFWLSGDNHAVEDARRQILHLCTQTKSVSKKPGTPTTHVGYSNSNDGSVGSRRPTVTRTFTFPMADAIYLDDLVNHAWNDIAAETGADHLAIAESDEAIPRPILRITGTKTAVAEAGAAAKAFLRRSITTTVVNDFKSAMRLVPAPVAVITTVFSESGKPREKGIRSGDNIIHAGWRGMTVSSFTSISLSPVPVISFNVRKPSRTLDALYRKGKFNLHIPTANGLGKTIANAFTIPRDDPAETFFDMFNTKDLALNSSPPNFLPAFGGPAVRLRYLCKLLPEKTVNIGDHDVLFAEVQEVRKFDAEGKLIKDQPKQSDASIPTGLVYANGKYCIADEMTEPFVQPEVEQRPQDLSEKYFSDAAEARPIEEPNATREAEQVSEIADTEAANTDLSPAYTPSATSSAPSPTPTSNSFWSKQRPAATASSPSDTSRRSMSTSTDKKIDAKTLSTKVEDYVFQPFAPENRRRLLRLRTRLRQKAILDTALEKLEESWQSGAMDGDSFKAVFTQIAELRRDVIDNEVDEAEFQQFVKALEVGMGEISADEVSMGEEKRN